MIQSPIEELIIFVCYSDNEFIPRYWEGFLRRLALLEALGAEFGNNWLLYVVSTSHFTGLEVFFVFVERRRLSFRNVALNLCMDIFDSAHLLGGIDGFYLLDTRSSISAKTGIPRENKHIILTESLDFALEPRF